MLKIAFRGDYSNEFGGISRPWVTYQVIDKEKIIGMIEQEPDDYIERYKAYNSDCVIGGNYIGKYKTKKEAVDAIKKSIKL